MNQLDTVAQLFKNAYAQLLLQQLPITSRTLTAAVSHLTRAHTFLSLQLSAAVTPEQQQALRSYAEQIQMKAAPVGQAVPLREVFRQYNQYQYSQINDRQGERHPDQISSSTWVTYSKCWRLIEAYIQFLGEPGFEVGKVDYAFATNLKEWLVQQPKTNGAFQAGTYMSATINKVLTMLKTLVTYAQSKGYVKVNPIISFRCRGGSVADPKPLLPEQVAYLETSQLPPLLRQYCDSWLVALELCLHYTDYMRLPGFQFLETPGQRIVHATRGKQKGSKLTITVDVTERAERILKKYGGPQGLIYVSSSNFSKQLKSIARHSDLRDAAGDLTDLQFGMGRDTGLTQRAIEGASELQLSKMVVWSKPVYANRYVGNPVEVVKGFTQRKLREQKKGQSE